MMNFLSVADRTELILRLKLWNEAATRRMRWSPAEFRRLLLLDDAHRTPLERALQSWQRADLAALDPAWQRLAGQTSQRRGETLSPLVRRAYIERPRGHSKTTDLSVQILWILLVARQSVIGLAAAADREQARLIHEAMARLARANPELCRELQFLEHLVRNRITGAQLKVISSDVGSSYGVVPDFIVCDELCHWENADLWHSLFSSAAKKPNCVLTVLTNAGVGRGWQWQVREQARTSPHWYFSSLAGPHAPWITDESLLEQRAFLPTPVFERLWLNLWQHSDGEFITLAEAEACRDDSLSYQQEGRRGIPYVAAIDYAEKRDNTVGCVCHREGDRILVDRMDVVCPTPNAPVKVAWVNDWIHDVGNAFPDVQFIVDPHQLVQTIQQLEGRYRIRRFDFHGGVGNHRLATTLHQLLVGRRIAWYPGCGSTDAAKDDSVTAVRNDLETELAALLVRQSGSGRMRFDHRQGGDHHDDRAFALAVAALELCEHPPESNYLQISSPAAAGGFCW